MAELQLFNSLTRQKERFQSIEAGRVGMYVCGMTVYDYCHIGHARVMIVFDVLARHLRSLGYALHYVRNITDIDDKIIHRALERQQSLPELTQYFIDAMHEDESALLCLQPDQEPKATAAISGMIAMIKRLIDKGYAYAADNGDVYYAVRQFPEYGKLSNRNIDDLRAGERIAINEAKRDPLDFVLWKAAKAGEPSWDSPWGAGRPGWHIECSVMSHEALGARFDIHGGGMDLKFPHHECEIAQSEAFCGHQHVRYWLHNGFVNVNDEKMSKSLGNFFTVREVLKHFDGEVIRMLVLGSHYRSPLNYNDIALEESQRALQRLYAAAAVLSDAPLDSDSVQAFEAAMNDDLNTPKALAVLFDLTRRINAGESALAATLRHLGGRLGLLQQDAAQLFHKNKADVDVNRIEALIAERAAAKKVKDFARADAIRQQLLDEGIALKDTANGCEWHKK